MLIADLETYKGAKYPLTMPENTDTLPNLESDFSEYEKEFFNKLLGAKEGESLYIQILQGNKIVNQYTPLINGVLYVSKTGIYRKTLSIIELMKKYCFVNYLIDKNYTIAFDGSVVQLNTTGVLNSSNIQKDVKGFEVARRWNNLVDHVGDYYTYIKSGYFNTACVYDYITLNASEFKDVDLTIWAKKSLI